MLTVLADPQPDCAKSGTSICKLAWDQWGNAWLAKSADWVIGRPLHILLIVVLALITRWLMHRVINRISKQSAAGIPSILKPLKERVPDALFTITVETPPQGLVTERRKQRAEAMGSLLRSTASTVILVVAGMMILEQIGLDLAPLLTSAGIAGVALGFGAQSLVKDVLSGIFMLLEDQYGVGDIIDTGEASGTVEAVGLRVTTLRDVRGVLWYVRNGEIVRVGNKSQSWAQVVVDVPVDFGAGVEEAIKVMRHAAEEFGTDPAYAEDFIAPPEVLGVEQITVDGAVVRTTAKTTSDSQWTVARELRRRLTDALEDAGIAARMTTRRFRGTPDSADGL